MPDVQAFNTALAQTSPGAQTLVRLLRGDNLSTPLSRSLALTSQTDTKLKSPIQLQKPTHARVFDVMLL